MIPNDRYGGYIALVSILIISAILLMITFESATGSFFARFTVSNLESARANEASADACGSIALLYLAEDGAYRPSRDGQLITIKENQSCIIREISFSGNTYTIKTYSSDNGVFRSTVITAEISTESHILSIQSWKH